MCIRDSEWTEDQSTQSRGMQNALNFLGQRNRLKECKGNSWIKRYAESPKLCSQYKDIPEKVR